MADGEKDVPDTGDDETKLLEVLTEGEAAPADDDPDALEDFEAEPGVVRKVTKWSKDHILRDADYRKKTMEIAEKAKAYEAKERELGETQKQFEARQTRELKFRKEVGRLEVMDETLAEYEKVNWQQAEAQDEKAAASAWRDYQILKDKRTKLAGEVGRKLREDEAADRAAAQKRRDAYAKELQGIKGWSPEKEVAVKKLLTEAYGFSADEIDNFSDARAMKLANDALFLNDLRRKSAERAKAPPAEPVTKLGGAARASTAPSEKDDMATFIRKRNEQEYRARKASLN